MIKRILMFSILLTGTVVAQEAKVTPLLSKDLTGIPGKEGLMITVDYAPGVTDASPVIMPTSSSTFSKGRL